MYPYFIPKWVLISFFFLTPVYSGQFLTIADIHLDAANKKHISYGQDTGVELWDSTIAELKLVIAREKPKFILLLGDLPKHNDREHLRANLAKVLQTISKLSKIPVFYAFGNNDSLVSNYGPYYDGKNNLFYLDPNKGWPALNVNSGCSNLSKSACMISKVSADGYYSAYPLGMNAALRLISLNTVLFSRKAAFNIEAAQAQMDWLESELKLAVQNKEAVYIMMHIPLGSDSFIFVRELWNTKLILKNGKNLRDNFLSLMQRYKKSIRIVISAHIHANEIRALSADKDISKMDVLNIGVPGISPNHYTNPGFQVYSYDKSFNLKDALTFYTTPKPSGWQTFSFQADYRCPKNSTMFSCVKLKILDKLSARWSNIYKRNYSLRNPNFNPNLLAGWRGIFSTIRVA